MYKGTKEEKNRKWREWYHKVGYSKYKCRNSKIRRLKIRGWFTLYKDHLKCKTCGETHIATLDFHHKDPNEKEIEISVAASQGWSIKRLTEELNKCDVLCCKCHRILHYEENKTKKENPTDVPKLTDNEKPNYLGYHGNGGHKSFDELNIPLTCAACGEIYYLLKSTHKKRVKKGCKETYCSKKCYLASRQKVNGGNTKKSNVVLQELQKG